MHDANLRTTSTLGCVGAGRRGSEVLGWVMRCGSVEELDCTCKSLSGMTSAFTCMYAGGVCTYHQTLPFVSLSVRLMMCYVALLVQSRHSSLDASNPLQ